MELKSKVKYGLAGIDSIAEKKALVDGFTAVNGECVDSPDWDLLWYINHEPPPELYKNISDLRRINHIPGISNLTDKWELYTNLVHHLKRSESNNKSDQIQRYFPKSWKLPEHREEILQHLQDHPNSPLILKLLNSVNGVGIKLLQYGDALPNDNHWLVQEYISNPHLINNRKYILQVFLLITSTNPLTVYLYQNGVADLAVLPYSNAPEQRNNQGVHIANTLLQSRQVGFDLKQHCLPLTTWREHVAQSSDEDIVWKSIEIILKETLFSVQKPLQKIAEPLLAHPEQCFELLAVDIMLDSTFNPWLIECNRSASMQPKYSGNLKPVLLKDALSLILARREILRESGTDCFNQEPSQKAFNFNRLI